MNYKLSIRSDKYIIVDAIAENKKQSIAIKCGKVSQERLQLLKIYFKQVIHIPFGIPIITPERIQLEVEKANLQKERDNLEEIKRQIKNKAFNELRDFYCKRCKNKVKATERIRKTLNKKEFTI